MNELVKIVEEGLESEKRRITAQVEEEFELAKRSMITKIESYFKDGNQTSARTNMKLKFRNWDAQTIFTGDEIKGAGEAPIEVALVDDSVGTVVDAEPEASADVEIVLLKHEPEEDDWTTEAFNANIVPEVEGKKPLLDGNVSLQLQGGVGIMKNIRIRHHASRIKPSEFKLGARVVGDSRIREARTEHFTLRDYRDKRYEKHQNPYLTDEVSRLVNIRKGGNICKRLEDKQICTVEDFLIQLMINPEGLKSIVMPQTKNQQSKKWEAIVKNARDCLTGDRVFFYMDHEQKTGIIFNILGHVLGGYCSPESTLSEEHKEKLLAKAYKNWGEVKAFENRNSVQQHLTWLGKCKDPLDSETPHCPGGGQDTSEMVGESSSRRSYVSCPSRSSTMNLSELDFGSFDGDMNGDPMQLHHDWPFSPVYFECVDQQTYGCSMELESQTKEPSPTFFDGVEQEISRRIAPKRWKKLLCILRWLMRTGDSVDAVTPSLKKRKID